MGADSRTEHTAVSRAVFLDAQSLEIPPPGRVCDLQARLKKTLSAGDAIRKLEAVKQPVTKAIVAVCVAVYFYAWYLLPWIQGPGAVDDFIATFGLLPSAFRNGAVWQPITALFLHDGRFLAPVHILVNMIGIWSLGKVLEGTIGSARFAWLCFFSGATGSLFVILFQSGIEHETIGASGVLCGLLGALAFFYPRSPMLVFFIPMKARTAALVLFVISILSLTFGWMAVISHAGHLGGLVGGVLYSRFALGLKFMEGDLHKQESYLRKKLMEQEALRTLFERMTGRQPDTRWRDPSVPGERVINPMPGEPVEEERPAKRLFYDPVTGKFIIR